MVKVGDVLTCALEGCKNKFTVETRRQLRKKFCCSNHKFQAWFRRTYVRKHYGN